jgi:hypothetical protein
MTSVEKRQKVFRDKTLRRLRRKREQRTRLDRLIRSRQPVTPPQGLADQLDLLAETTAPFDERYSTHAMSEIRSTGTMTGKLYYISWLVRWWTGGPFMRRKLLVSVAAVIVTLAVIMWLTS